MWVSVKGKNLFESKAAATTSNGVTLTVNEDKSVTANGTATNNNVWYNISTAGSHKLNFNGNYILSGCPNGGSESKYYILVVDRGIDDAHDCAFYYDCGNGVEIPFNSTHYYRMAIVIMKDVTVNNLTFYPMIRLASITDSTYEPYNEQTLSISTPNGLPGIPVSNGGNYTDESGQQWVCDEIDFANGKYVQRCKKYIFNGTEFFTGNTGSTGGGIVCSSSITDDILKNTANGVKSGNAFCTHLLEKTANDLWNIAEDGFSVTVDSTYKIRIRITSVTTLEEFKTKLAEWYANGTPLTFLYRLETPIETDLTAEEIEAYKALHTYYPVTNIQNDSGVGMKVGYYADTKLYIDNKINELATAIVAGSEV